MWWVIEEAHAGQGLARRPFLGMASQDEWIGTEEAARRIGMGTDWVRTQIAAGRLAARLWQVGKRTTIRIRVADLEEFRRRHSRDLGPA